MKKFSFYGKQAIIFTDGNICKEPYEITITEIFADVIHKFLEHLRSIESPLLDVLPEMPEKEQDDYVVSLLQQLAQKTKDEVISESPRFSESFRDTYQLHQFVETLYNFWRSYERFLVCYSHNSESNAAHKRPGRTFNETIEHLNYLVRNVYRDICRNITGQDLWVYRQMPAGCEVGIIAAQENWPCPEDYKSLKGINFIKQILIEPPLIIDPPMNTRSGQFLKVDSNPLEDAGIEPEKWLCYPAKVGDLIIHLFFHKKFMGLGTACVNLFDMCSKEDMKRKPDAIYAYGVDEGSLEKYDSKTVFYDDEENGMLVAAVPNSDEFAYFGYVKKMMLTMHNVIMMKRGRLPIHGAMVRISLKNGKSANIIILGDTGAGKSESLEAFRILGDKYIRDMTIIFDDMGSIELGDDGNIKAYGTETGAFVRLDDLQPGFAFGNIDRSIIMSPQKVNARALLPVTTLQEVLHGYPVDYFLYANNYEEVDDNHPFFEQLKNPEEALDVFRDGARMAKGTTTEKGLVHAYFANIFGPPQYKELHDKLAVKYFDALFKTGTKVAQLRTRLGIPGFETKGPETAAKALFEEISK
ncbi:phosphoenolpyruvate carboxykinase [Candidatus Woesearchaeota archaeon]|nr:phosphoenolpyruvate carboxykinase [Candidatus Woesearchaeota archaeon]